MAKFKPRKSPAVKPKFNVKDFTTGVTDFGQLTAIDFILFVQDKISRKQYDFKIVEEMLGIKKGALTSADVANAITSESQLVFVRDGKLIEQITFKDLVLILERGRRDKGLLPNPVLRSAFDEYRPIFRERVKNFLLGKKL